MLKKILSLILVGVMALSLVACGGDSNTSGTSNTSVKSKNVTRPSEHIYWYVTDNGTVLHLSSTKPTDENYVEGNDNWENIFVIGLYDISINDSDFDNRYNDIKKMGLEIKLKMQMKQENM